MERILTADEKIRRAEEIYARRNNQKIRNNVAKVNVNDKKDLKLFKRLFLQIIICLLIYTIFYLIQTTNYVFSDNVINKTKDILSYDINFNSIYNQIASIISVHNQENDENVKDKEEKEKEENLENKEDNAVKEDEGLENKLEEGTLSVIDIKDEEDKSTVSQMDLDVLEIKQKCDFIKPLEGVVSSEFGQREVTAKEVTPEHYGIDIAAKTGTDIKAAMSGEVIVASYNSQYGNFIKIVKDDVMTVYAHCKKLLVKVGDTVNQGDVIAKVGSTRKFYRSTSTFRNKVIR